MNLCFKIGPAVISIDAEEPPHRWPERWPHESYTPFLYRNEGGKAPALALRLRFTPPPSPQHAFPLGEMENNWRLFACEGGYRLEIMGRVRFQAAQVVLIRPDWSEADCYFLRSPQPGLSSSSWHLREVIFPLIQWWLTAWLAFQGKGLILHGAAVSMEGQGLAFVGPSGAGKTTLSRWCQAEGASVLNDERILLWRDEEGEVWVGGTPWHGELPVVSPEVVRLSALFLLKQSDDIRFVPLRPAEWMGSLIPRAFLPLWSSQGMSGVLAFCAGLAERCSIGRLEFTKDSQVVHYLRKFPGANHVEILRRYDGKEAQAV